MRRMFLALLGSLLTVATTASARFGMPEPLTERGAIMEDIYVKIFIAGLAFFVIVMVGMAWVLFRYREGTGHGRQTHEKHRHSTAAEVSWTVIPLIVVLWIGYISYIGLVELDEAVAPGEHDYELKIIASQWNWEAQYEEGFSVFASPDSNDGSVKESNYFLVPSGKNILLNITSLDVIHALHIMDANQMTVGLVDANPLGDHKYNTMVINFEEGDYPVQCREMCFNPGHAYMRAHIKSVPQSVFDAWATEKALCQGAKLCVKQDLALGEPGFEPSENVTGVVGSRYMVRFQNTLGEAVTIDAPGKTVNVAAGANKLFAFELDAPGVHRLSVTGESGQVLAERWYEGIEATPMQVILGEFVFEPDTLQFNAGETYFLTLDNTHTVPHNLYIGDFASGNVIAASEDIAGGAAGGLLVTFDEPTTLDIWCNVAGHYDAGMHGAASVA